MPRTRVYPYRAGSRGASALAAALGGRVLRLEGSSFSPRDGDTIINWGNTGGMDIPHGVTTYNFRTDLRVASNKLFFFRRMRDAGFENVVPPFWESRDAIPDEAYPVVCRTVLAGHSGDGIVIADNAAGLVAASLYVKYMKKRDEYRIHVGRRNGQSIIISVQQKLRSREAEVVDTRVRNHDNGYIFARNNVNPPECVIENAKVALEACGLDFGAVDVIYNAHYGRAYVLEINTSPGLEGTTVEDYARFFQGR